jgi:hypothetical protein
MHAQCLVAEFASLEKAQVGVEVLESFDFQSDAVSLVTRADDEELQKIADQQRGTDDQAAKDYEQRVREGSVLVIVTSTPPRLNEAERGLQTTGPKTMERFSAQPLGN